MRFFFHFRRKISCAHNISAAQEILRGDPKLRTYLKRPSATLVSNGHAISKDDFKEATCAQTFSVLGTLGIP